MPSVLLVKYQSKMWRLLLISVLMSELEHSSFIPNNFVNSGQWNSAIERVKNIAETLPCFNVACSSCLTLFQYELDTETYFA